MTPVPADVRVSVHDAVAWAQRAVDGLTAGDIVLLLLAALLVTWIYLALRAATQLGPIEIATVTHDEPEASNPDIEGLTSLLRERLAHSGLSPVPTVPGGSPKTDLISAVAESDIPQVGWVAKLLDAVPRPQSTRYTVRATLLRVKGDRGTYAERKRLRFWLQPDGGGSPLLRTIIAGTDSAAVDQAVAEIFAHISTDAVDVFPAWASWQSRAALEQYLVGLDLVRDGDLEAARAPFKEAARLEPTNALPRLQLANIAEFDAGKEKTRVDYRAARQAAALRQYLDLGMERTELVEPRYRAGVLAAMLAQTVGKPELATSTVPSIARRLRLPHPTDDPGWEWDADTLKAKLEQLARREADATLAILRAWYVLLSRQRLRYRYELRGDERRELLQTVLISRHCVAVRSQQDLWKAWWRRISVRFVHLGLRRILCGWQAFYNAGCFYALLADQTTSVNRSRRLRERSYRCLTNATEAACGRLSVPWMAYEDPDLEPLRVARPQPALQNEEAQDPEWHLLLQRAEGKQLDIPGFPASPWIHPVGRALAWWGVGLVLAVGAGLSLALSHGTSWSMVLTAAVVVLGLPPLFYRGLHAFVERGFNGLPDARVRPMSRTTDVDPAAG